MTSHVDSHPDQGMLQTKGGKGFPYVVMMDDAGEVLTTFRPTSREAVQAAGTRAKEIVDLRAKVKANPKDDDSRARLLMATLRVKASDDDRQALAGVMKSAKVTAATKAAYQGFESREKILAFGDEMQAGMRGIKDKEGRETAAKEWQGKAYKLFKGGLAPAEGGTEYLNYLINATYGAIAAKDRKTATSALKAVEESGKGIESLKKTADELRDKIAAL